MTSDLDRELMPQLTQLESDVLALAKDLAPDARRGVSPLVPLGDQPLHPRLISLAGSFGSPAPEHLRRLAIVVEMLRAGPCIHDDLTIGRGARRPGPRLPDSRG